MTIFRVQRRFTRNDDDEKKTIRSANQVFFCFGVKVVGEKLESMDYEGNETDDHVVSHHVVEIGKCI